MMQYDVYWDQTLKNDEIIWGQHSRLERSDVFMLSTKIAGIVLTKEGKRIS